MDVLSDSSEEGCTSSRCGPKVIKRRTHVLEIVRGRWNSRSTPDAAPQSPTKKDTVGAAVPPSDAERKLDLAPSVKHPIKILYSLDDRVLADSSKNSPPERWFQGTIIAVTPRSDNPHVSDVTVRFHDGSTDMIQHPWQDEDDVVVLPIDTEDSANNDNVPACSSSNFSWFLGPPFVDIFGSRTNMLTPQGASQLRIRGLVESFLRREVPAAIANCPCLRTKICLHREEVSIDSPRDQNSHSSYNEVVLTLDFNSFEWTRVLRHFAPKQLPNQKRAQLSSRTTCSALPSQHRRFQRGRTADKGTSWATSVVRTETPPASTCETPPAHSTHRPTNTGPKRTAPKRKGAQLASRLFEDDRGDESGEMGRVVGRSNEDGTGTLQVRELSSCWGLSDTDEDAEDSSCGNRGKSGEKTMIQREWHSGSTPNSGRHDRTGRRSGTKTRSKRSAISERRGCASVSTHQKSVETRRLKRRASCRRDAFEEGAGELAFDDELNETCGGDQNHVSDSPAETLLLLAQQAAETALPCTTGTIDMSSTGDAFHLTVPEAREDLSADGVEGGGSCSTASGCACDGGRGGPSAQVDTVRSESDDSDVEVIEVRASSSRPLSTEVAEIRSSLPRGKPDARDKGDDALGGQGSAQGDDDEVSVVKSVGKVTLPHARHHCLDVRFFEAGSVVESLKTNSKACPLCYCWVCDVPWRECPSWAPSLENETSTSSDVTGTAPTNPDDSRSSSCPSSSGNDNRIWHCMARENDSFWRGVRRKKKRLHLNNAEQTPASEHVTHVSTHSGFISVPPRESPPHSRWNAQLPLLGSHSTTGLSEPWLSVSPLVEHNQPAMHLHERVGWHPPANHDFVLPCNTPAFQSEQRGAFQYPNQQFNYYGQNAPVASIAPVATIEEPWECLERHQRANSWCRQMDSPTVAASSILHQGQFPSCTQPAPFFGTNYRLTGNESNGLPMHVRERPCVSENFTADNSWALPEMNVSPQQPFMPQDHELSYAAAVTAPYGRTEQHPSQIGSQVPPWG